MTWVSDKGGTKTVLFIEVLINHWLHLHAKFRHAWLSNRKRMVTVIYNTWFNTKIICKYFIEKLSVGSYFN